jgi:tRNA A-37 threonylcarbamoyl transferase component Bud32
MGLLLEFLVGRRPEKNNLAACTTTLRRLHNLGLAHHDINRDNFIIMGSSASLIDFENSGTGTEEEQAIEMGNVYKELIDESGRGAPSCGEDFGPSEYSIGI